MRLPKPCWGPTAGMQQEKSARLEISLFILDLINNIILFIYLFFFF